MKKFSPEEAWLLYSDIVLHSKTLVHLEQNSSNIPIVAEECNSLTCTKKLPSTNDATYKKKVTQ